MLMIDLRVWFCVPWLDLAEVESAETEQGRIQHTIVRCKETSDFKRTPLLSIL